MVTARAYAKVNLTLDVVCRRPDGLHELSGIMQSVGIFDTLTLRRAKSFTLVSNVRLPEQNTITRAAELLLGGRGVAIELTKRIPSEAGMGGASADAAAVLRALPALYPDIRVMEEELMRIALTVGADVPFCMTGGCAHAAGTGELLTPLPTLDLPLLIVKGRVGISTAALFKSLCLPKADAEPVRPDPAELPDVRAVLSGDTEALAGLMHNGLQAASEMLAPEIAQLADRLRAQGAKAVTMTGSGSAVAALFCTMEEAVQAEKKFSDLPFVRACRTVPQGVEII